MNCHVKVSGPKSTLEMREKSLNINGGVLQQLLISKLLIILDL